MSVWGLLRLCRLYYALPMSGGYLLTLYYARAGRMDGQWRQALLSTLALAMVIAAGYAWNDFFDWRVDRAGRRRRPIPAGQATPASAVLLATALLLGGLGMSLAARPTFGLTLLAVAAGLFAYDVVSKRLGVGKQLLVAGLMTSIYPLAIAQAGGAVGPRAASLAVFPVWLFVTSFGYEVLKDLRDADSDPVVRGRRSRLQAAPARWRRIANAAIAGGSLLLIAPGFLGCGWVYLCLAGVAIALAWVTPWARLSRAIGLAYAEVFLVAVAATLDVLILGV